MNRQITVNNVKTSLLSWTEDMDCWSFSLPAGFACPMAQYGENTICGSCYAQINRYNMPNVLRAQFIRLEFIKDKLRTPEGTTELINTFVDAIGRQVQNGHFRWFDSGDFINVKFIRVCTEICRRLPDIKFWFPTRSWPHTRPLPNGWEEALTELNNLANVVVRPSAIHFNDEPPVVAYLGPGSTAHTTLNEQPEGCSQCPKTVNGGNCSANNCRECWDSEREISYFVHGFMGKHKPANAQSERITETRQRIRGEVLTELTLNRSSVA